MSLTPRALVRWAIGITVVGLLVVGIDLSGVVEHLSGADATLAAAGVIGLTAIHLVAAATWRILVERLSGVRLGWREATSTYYVAQALGSLTPASLGGDAYRIYVIRAAGHPAATSVAPVVVQRVTSYAALSILAVAAVMPLWSLAQPALEIVAVAVVALVGLTAAVFVGLVARRSRRPSGIVGERGGGGFRSATDGLRRLAVTVGLGTLLGLVFHASAISLTYLLVLAVAPGAPTVPVLASLAVARLSIAFPLTPSGLGVQEGLLVLLFAGLGLAPAGALAALLLSRVALLLTAGIGAATFVSSSAGKGPAAAFRAGRSATGRCFAERVTRVAPPSRRV